MVLVQVRLLPPALRLQLPALPLKPRLAICVHLRGAGGDAWHHAWNPPPRGTFSPCVSGSQRTVDALVRS